MMKPIAIIVFLVLILSGCSSPRPKGDGAPKHVPKNLLSTPNATPKFEPLSRFGNFYGKSRTNSYIVKKKRYHVMRSSRGYRERGLASWYGTLFHGRKTSNGEHYNMFAMTAAHKTLPLPCYVKVRNLENGRSIIVKVNDRGPFHKNRVIDLSYVAAAKLGMLGTGTARVELTSVDPRDNAAQTQRKKPPSLRPQLLKKHHKAPRMAKRSKPHKTVKIHRRKTPKR